MFNVTIYEDGQTYDYYIEGNKSAINMNVKNYEDLLVLLNIILDSGHSIEILKPINEIKGE